jgi:hypothetical protein
MSGDPRDWGCWCSGPFDTPYEEEQAKKSCPYHNRIEKELKEKILGGPHCEICRKRIEEDQEREFQKIVTAILGKMEDLKPEVVDAINKHFWELF